VESVGHHGTLLGVTAEPRLDDFDFHLAPGESLVLFTDGILRKDEAFGDVPQGMVASLLGASITSAAELRARIERYVDDLVAQGQDDDIAMLLLRAR
jgi:serine phosphatase RsbU (regulator of sigma subunit)